MCMFNWFPHNLLIQDLFLMIFSYTKVLGLCQESETSEMIKCAYKINVQLIDSKLKIQNLIHMVDPAKRLEITTDTNSTSIVFNR